MAMARGDLRQSTNLGVRSSNPVGCAIFPPLQNKTGNLPRAGELFQSR